MPTLHAYWLQLGFAFVDHLLVKVPFHSKRCSECLRRAPHLKHVLRRGLANLEFALDKRLERPRCPLPWHERSSCSRYDGSV